MTTVKANTKTVTKTVQEKVPDGVTVELSQDEAEALRSLLGQVNYLSVLNNLYHGLGNAGVQLGKYKVGTSFGTITVEAK